MGEAKRKKEALNRKSYEVSVGGVNVGVAEGLRLPYFESPSGRDWSTPNQASGSEGIVIVGHNPDFGSLELRALVQLTKEHSVGVLVVHDSLELHGEPDDVETVLSILARDQVQKSTSELMELILSEPSPPIQFYKRSKGDEFKCHNMFRRRGKG